MQFEGGKLFLKLAPMVQGHPLFPEEVKRQLQFTLAGKIPSA